MPASATITDQEVEVVLETPLVGVAPGQAVVLYEDDRVVGSATISATRSVAAAR